MNGALSHPLYDPLGEAVLGQGLQQVQRHHRGQHAVGEGGRRAGTPGQHGQAQVVEAGTVAPAAGLVRVPECQQGRLEGEVQPVELLLAVTMGGMVGMVVVAGGVSLVPAILVGDLGHRKKKPLSFLAAAQSAMGAREGRESLFKSLKEENREFFFSFFS